MTSKHTNALINETSPYLLQHANNPVDWYPWGEEALEKARAENKPILLSVGYSACHWCHVMAHESFENEETAAIMNEHFINIKVDREERPDIDKIYQLAQHLLTQRSGGWPLTMFLTPGDQLPFFGGTYFPPEPRYGMPGFKDVLERIAGFYVSERESIEKQNRSVKDALERIGQTPAVEPGLQLDSAPMDQAVRQLEESFDSRHGGFGPAPKFPHPSNLDFLLRMAADDPDNTSLATMIDTTFRKMALGGVYDQVGGGFYRYSVDDHWEIPHFEKMLYDNGPLLELYTRAWQLIGTNLYQRIARETADWVMRDMQSPEGAYYSTLDADSEGVEGKFYVWEQEELKLLLDEKEFSVIEQYFNLRLPANFEGRWHLHVTQELDYVAQQTGHSIDEASRLLLSARGKLLAARNQRIWPGRDEKILTSWNGLMITGMARAAIAFSNEDYFNSASRSLAFIRNTLWKEGHLLATYKDGKAHLNAYLDDYAFLVEGILSLLSYRWDSDWLAFAIELTDAMLAKFEDSEDGGFYFTSHDHEQLIQRNKPYMDDALPAGNAVAARVLLQLGHLLGNTDYLTAGERSLKSAWALIGHFPVGHCTFLTALKDYLRPPRQVIIRGSGDELGQWQQTAQRDSGPYDLIYAIPDAETRLPGILNQREPGSETRAYICTGTECLAPLNRLDLLSENLKNG
ncbi:MAG: thioredoxin domain-containing protein [Gammaproteobacteria bacterium]